MADNNKDVGFKSDKEPFTVPRREFVVILFNPDEKENPLVQEKIKQIAYRYGSLRGILFHMLPTKSLLVAEGKNTDFYDFLYSLFDNIISYAPTPTYQGNVHTLIADNSLSADVYVIGEATFDMELTIAEIAKREIKITTIPLIETNVIEFEMAFEKEMSRKNMGELTEAIRDVFIKNHIHFDLTQFPSALQGTLRSIDDSMCVEQIHELIKDFVASEKLKCNIQSRYNATPEEDKAKYVKESQTTDKK